MNQKIIDAYRVAFTLKEQEKSWAEITGELKDKGYVNQQGRPFPESTLRKKYSTFKKDPVKWRLIMGEGLRPEHGAESSVTGEERMKEIAEEVCGRLIQEARNEWERARIAPRVGNVELDELPEPERTGRKENRLYLKLAATVDLVLADRLIALAKQEKSSVGKMLDRILRKVFNKPLLSYQLSPEELEPLKDKHKTALAALNRRKRK